MATLPLSKTGTDQRGRERVSVRQASFERQYWTASTDGPGKESVAREANSSARGGSRWFHGLLFDGAAKCKAAHLLGGWPSVSHGGATRWGVASADPDFTDAVTWSYSATGESAVRHQLDGLSTWHSPDDLRGPMETADTPNPQWIHRWILLWITLWISLRGISFGQSG